MHGRECPSKGDCQSSASLMMPTFLWAPPSTPRTLCLDSTWTSKVVGHPMLHFPTEFAYQGLLV